MRTVIYIIIFIVWFFFMARTSVQFHPFKITFASIYSAIGWTLMVAAVICFETQGSRNCIENVKKVINKIEVEK